MKLSEKRDNIDFIGIKDVCPDEIDKSLNKGGVNKMNDLDKRKEEKSKCNTPFFMDFAFEVPDEVVIESPSMARDSTTVGPPPHSDDD